MSESSSISTGIAERYASAVFDLAKEAGELDKLESDVNAFNDALVESPDLRDLISNPVYSRSEQSSAIGAIAEKLGVSETMANTLRLMASKRRLFVVPQLGRALLAMIREHKGEVIADVSTARELSDDQQAKLAATLKSSVGKDVKMNVTVDESLIGGLIVRVGSKMIDTSVRSKLAALQNTMKEVG